MKNICGIYKITSPSKKIYIGQSRNICKRKSYYKNIRNNKQTRIYRSIKKYGFDKHKFEIIHECLPEELNELEIYYIELYQTFNSKYGMNLREGGNCKFKVSRETVEKQRLLQIGKKLTEEHKQNIREGNKGKHSYLAKGTKRSEESKIRTSIGHKGLIRSEEHRRNLSLSMKGRKTGLIKKSSFKKGSIPWNKGLKKINNKIVNI